MITDYVSQGNENIKIGIIVEKKIEKNVLNIKKRGNGMI